MSVYLESMVVVSAGWCNLLDAVTGNRIIGNSEGERK